MHRLERLQLRLCGRPFGPETAAALSGGGVLAGLVSLELGGAYRLTDQPLLDGADHKSGFKGTSIFLGY